MMQRGERGLGLVELVISIGVTTMILGTIGAALAATLRTTTTANNQQHATEQLRNGLFWLTRTPNGRREPGRRRGGRRDDAVDRLQHRVRVQQPISAERREPDAHRHRQRHAGRADGGDGFRRGRIHRIAEREQCYVHADGREWRVDAVAHGDGDDAGHRRPAVAVRHGDAGADRDQHEHAHRNQHTHHDRDQHADADTDRHADTNADIDQHADAHQHVDEHTDANTDEHADRHADGHDRAGGLAAERLVHRQRRRWRDRLRVGFPAGHRDRPLCRPDDAVIRTSSMPAGMAKQITSLGALQPNLITSLGATSFVVGNDPSVNNAGTTYYWTAMRAGTEVAVGSYTGDGADNRNLDVTVFQPDWLMTIADGQDDYFRPALVAGDASFSMGGTSSASNLIQAIRPGRIPGRVERRRQRVRPGVLLDRLQPGRALVDGSYHGNGVGLRNITGLGINPASVWVNDRQRARASGPIPPRWAAGACTGARSTL